MPASKAVEMLIKDAGSKGEGFRGEFAKDEPIRSILQRQGKSIEKMLEIFDWKEDDAAWVSEYGTDNGGDNQRLVKYRRRMFFDVGGWRDVYEDFARGDVSCLRDIRTPLVTAQSPLREMKEEFNA